MARKRGEYQKRQERKMRNGIICVLMLFVVTILLCVCGIVESRYTIGQIDDGALTEYTGRYSYEYISQRKIFVRGRNRYYKITLYNGVVFALSARNRNSEIFDENPVIHVQYIQELFRDKYTAVSVTTADGATTLLSLESIRQSNVSLIWALSIVIVILSLFCLFFLMVLFEKQIKRFLSLRKKRRKIREKIEASK